MRTNKIVSRIRANEKAYGFTLTFPSSTVVELMGMAGFDFVQFDGEHGPFTPDILDDLCRAADAAGLTPIARVPDIESSTILRFLDRGIMGIMGPHITTSEDARRLADACRYVPLGKRSFGSGRGAHFGKFSSATQYMEAFNNQVIVIAQLEDLYVLEHLDDILNVDGIDLYGSGPQDIAQSMGLPGQPNHPRVKEYEKTIRDAVHAAGKNMMSDITELDRTTDMIYETGVEFLKTHGPGN